VASLGRRPQDATYWSRAPWPKSRESSKSTVGRIRKAFGLKRHLVDAIKISADPQSIDKVDQLLPRHAACKRTLSRLLHFVWWRVIRWLRALHRWRWKDVRRAFTTPQGRWKPVTAGGIELFNLEAVRVTRYRYRATIPGPWALEHP
jgi:hypothetical protein